MTPSHLPQSVEVFPRVLRTCHAIDFLTLRGHEDIGGPAVDIELSRDIGGGRRVDLHGHVGGGERVGKRRFREGSLLQSLARRALLPVEVEHDQLALLRRLGESFTRLRDPGDDVGGGHSR